MAATKKIRFLYDLRGAECEFEVVKPFRDGWLCSVVVGPFIGEELVFQQRTIRVGQKRLALSRKTGAEASAVN